MWTMMLPERQNSASRNIENWELMYQSSATGTGLELDLYAAV